jgi:hybrid cluster-associated redox disulfide protein
MKVTKDMTIGELLMMDRSAGMILMQNGMHCVGCPSAAGETLEEASMVHGMNCDKLVADINAFLESKTN